MIQVKCPQCSAALSLKQPPPSGKIKCPKCSTIVTVAAANRPGTAAAPVKPAAGVRAATPATARGAGANPLDEIDFRSIPIPSTPAPSGFFPSASTARVYDGPVKLDPIPVQKNSDHDDDDEDEYSPSPASGKGANSKSVVIGLVALVALAAVGGGAYVMMSGGGDAGGGEVDVVAAAAAAAPTGFQAKGLHNCVVLMPAGSWSGRKIPSAIDAEIIESDATGSIFVLAAMDGGSQPIEADQMKKKAARSLNGEVLGGTPTQRNGYTGIKGVLDQSVFLPRLQVEIFHHDGRFVIIGHATASEMRAASGGDAAVAGGSAEEQAESQVFYNSFKIGPPKGGFFGN